MDSVGRAPTVASLEERESVSEMQTPDEQLQDARSAFGRVIAELTGRVRAWIYVTDQGRAPDEPEPPMAAFSRRAAAIEDGLCSVAPPLPAAILEPPSEDPGAIVLDAREHPSVRSIHELLSELPSRARVVLLLPREALTSQASAPLRADLARTHAVEWIVALQWHEVRRVGLRVPPPPKRGLAPAQPCAAAPVMAFASAAAVRLEVRGPGEGKTHLVELAGSPPSGWSALLHEGRRHIAWGTNATTFRRADLDEGPWTLLRFSRQFRRITGERAAFGPDRRLEELGDFRVGALRALLPRGNSGPMNPEIAVVHVLVGGTIVGETDRARRVPRGDIPDEDLLEVGDVVVSAARQEDGRPVVGLVEETHLPLALDDATLRIRWMATLDVFERAFVTDYLRSPFVAAWLAASPPSAPLSATELCERLRRLPVPAPEGRLKLALARSEVARRTYELWSLQEERRREDLTAEIEDRALTVRRFLELARMQEEKLDAAEAATTLDGRVRARFPRPVAIRREFVRAAESGALRLDAALACAEHLTHLLAVLALIQLAPDNELATGVMTSSVLRDRLASQPVVRLDWGTVTDILRSAAAATRRMSPDERVRAPFPELDSLGAVFAATPDRPEGLLVGLQGVRNRVRHLHEYAEEEACELANGVVDDLDRLLDASSFLADISLARVRRYENAAGRRIRYELLRGTSSTPQIFSLEVDTEVTEGSIVFIDVNGRVRSAYPWLLAQPNPDSRFTSSVRRFDRFEKGPDYAAFVDLETGRPSHEPRASAMLASWLDALRPDPDPDVPS